ncbi:MAG: 4Fe-4S dicluster domain-containing protein [Phycisphaerae bacterium]|nr:4Fe-4S dicluster domain-containing protein [Phycisphaerae bacterium]
MNEKHHNPIVYTDTAQCRDCYRCVRVCPVKAIKMHDGQASVDADLCIACGNCFRQCPQHAKMYQRHLTIAKKLTASNRKVIATVAPSFAALLEEWQLKRLPSALRNLGFDLITETSLGAWHVSREIAKMVNDNPDQPLITSACPAVVRYLELYRSDALNYLTPIASPMIVHGRMLKEQYPDHAVIFIGPCVAKKTEIARQEYSGIIDAALTFEELFEWFDAEKIDLRKCEESDFDQKSPGQSALYPLVGGSLPAAGISTDMLASDVITASGIEEIDDAIDSVIKNPNPVLIEPLFCRFGCINGPVANWDESQGFQRRKQVIDYSREKNDYTPAKIAPELLACSYINHNIVIPDFTETQINEVYAMTGKTSEQSRLNCGACGYGSCQEQAIAVLRGMAEPEMCIPYMRRMAEQRTDRIIETSPNGIVILDEHLNIISMNPAFRKMFVCSDAIFGQSISRLMDPDMFEKVLQNPNQKAEGIIRHDPYNLITHQIVYKIPESKQTVGIFMNITNLKSNQQKLDNLRFQTVQKARELLSHQVAMAHKIVEHLGTSTAQSEELLANLLKMADDQTPPDDQTDNEKSKKYNPWK